MCRNQSGSHLYHRGGPGWYNAHESNITYFVVECGAELHKQCEYECGSMRLGVPVRAVRFSWA